jgi:hypothetical protein
MDFFSDTLMILTLRDSLEHMLYTSLALLVCSIWYGISLDTLMISLFLQIGAEEPNINVFSLDEFVSLIAVVAKNTKNMRLPWYRELLSKTRATWTYVSENP